ncbi:unnamed protein product [Spirodela intermedia]|uniref:Uncharacterized protein n=1 Tax=Spirodela intermedia TaxID=51605 RepID=A0A7I8KI52_SPIIN|nr:unnamed protein product [Spirodela intermedia]
MALSPRFFLLLLLCLGGCGGRRAPCAEAQAGDATLQLVLDDAFEWPEAAAVNPFGELDGEGGDGEIAGGDGGMRRALFWRMVHYYISYGALSANRVPCPPRSGRSYYTHNCYRARSHVNPYSRGCSAITRCRS